MMTEEQKQINQRKPWYQSFYRYRLRKSTLTEADAGLLWERDGAAQMNRPYIERINDDLPFGVSNCRYVDYYDRRKRIVSAERKERIRRSRRLQRKRRVARVKSALCRYLADRQCADCGTADIIVFEFDHVRGTKVADVSKIIPTGSWANVLAEIEKCDVVCANCHRRRTATRNRDYRTRYAGLVANAADAALPRARGQNRRPRANVT